MRSPKRDNSNQGGRTSWYPYYAGYATGFVEDAIKFGRKAGARSRVLDPWNGSGTTTQVAIEQGLSATGFDLNPAMIIVARAKLLDASVLSSISSLVEDICSKAILASTAYLDDPLDQWLCVDASKAFRAIDSAISSLLIDRTQHFVKSHLASVDTLSSLACFFYVALFRTLRLYLTSFRGSNPTWIKIADTEASKVRITLDELLVAFTAETKLMSEAVMADASTCAPTPAPHAATIRLARSTALPVVPESFDLIISSPPYCTRIDYVVKTRPELALLGYTDSEFRLLRDGMLGTPTIPKGQRLLDNDWGDTCRGALNQIHAHPSRASSSYYWKTYVQYFEGLFLSIKELSKALAREGLCFLVVQDSYYKDVHIDLAAIAEDMAAKSGLQTAQRFDFSSPRTMSGLNSAAREYRARHSPVESVLVWRKAS